MKAFQFQLPLPACCDAEPRSALLQRVLHVLQLRTARAEFLGALGLECRQSGFSRLAVRDMANARWGLKYARRAVSGSDWAAPCDAAGDGNDSTANAKMTRILSITFSFLAGSQRRFRRGG